jgi:hypothetical protein
MTGVPQGKPRVEGRNPSIRRPNYSRLIGNAKPATGRLNVVEKEDDLVVGN